MPSARSGRWQGTPPGGRSPPAAAGFISLHFALASVGPIIGPLALGAIAPAAGMLQAGLAVGVVGALSTCYSASYNST